MILGDTIGSSKEHVHFRCPLKYDGTLHTHPIGYLADQSEEDIATFMNYTHLKADCIYSMGVINCWDRDLVQVNYHSLNFV